MALIVFMGEFFSLEFFENAQKISLIYPHHLGTPPLAQSPLPLRHKIFFKQTHLMNRSTGVALILKPLAQDFKGTCKTGTKSPSPFSNVPFPKILSEQ